MVNRWRRGIGRWAGTVSSNGAVALVSTRRSASSGSHSSRLWSSPRRPASTRRRAATDVIALVIDWMRIIASSRMGSPSTDATPTATTSGSRPPRSATAPGTVPASTWRTRNPSSSETTSVVVALAAEGLHGGRAGAGPLRHGPAGRAPGGDAVGVRAPVPADRCAMPTDRRVGLRGLGPALGVVLPRLAAAVGRHVEQAEGPVDRLVAPAGRGVGEEHAVAVAQETDDVPHFSADRRLHVAHRVPGLGVTHELDVGGDRKSTRLNSSHLVISYAVFCLKKKKKKKNK